jgi:pimeloyl-ACP methyl ester carboxylesterase
MPFAKHSDASIYFEDQGSGTCLLMAHSFLCSGAMWAAQAEALSSSFRVVNVDLRGHGQSSSAPAGLSLSDLANDHVAVLDHLGIERAVWVGLSIGGMIGMRAALEHPERVGGLVIADSSAASEPGIARLRYRAMGAGSKLFGIGTFMKPILKLMFGPTTHREQPELLAEWGERMKGVDLDSILRMMGPLFGREEVLSRLGEIRVPALVLAGEEDRAQPPARSREIADGLPNAELVLIPEAGHLSALEQPEVVTTVMRDFLAEAFPAAY